MVRNSDKTYGQLLLEAKKQTDRQEIGETVQPFFKDLDSFIKKTAHDQSKRCFEKGFHLEKYYIHFRITKDPWSPNVAHIKPHPIRITRPSPYQEKDHYLWSVTNLNQIKFEWCIPSNEMMNMFLSTPSKYDPDLINMLRKYKNGTLDKIDDYIIKGKIA